MFWASVFFVGWLALMALRGYVRGLWVSLFDLVGLLVAYIVCILFGQQLVALLQVAGVAFYLAYLLGFGLLFFVVNWLVSLAPRVIFANTLRKKKLLTWPGAALGGFSGLLSGLVMLWCFNFASGVFFNPEGLSGDLTGQTAMENNKDEAHLLVIAANTFVENIAKVAAKFGGVSSQHSVLVVAMAAAPSSLRSVSQSHELQQFYMDPQAQYEMATDNHQALLANPHFRALMEQAGVQSLRQSLAHNRAVDLTLVGTEQQQVDRALDQYLAQQLSYFWKRITLIKNDAEVQLLLQDEEVQQIIAEKNISGLLSNRKIQQILFRMSQNDQSVQGIDFTQYVDANYEIVE